MDVKDLYGLSDAQYQFYVLAEKRRAEEQADALNTQLATKIGVEGVKAYTSEQSIRTKELLAEEYSSPTGETFNAYEYNPEYIDKKWYDPRKLFAPANKRVQPTEGYVKQVSQIDRPVDDYNLGEEPMMDIEPISVQDVDIQQMPTFDPIQEPTIQDPIMPDPVMTNNIEPVEPIIDNIMDPKIRRVNIDASQIKNPPSNTNIRFEDTIKINPQTGQYTGIENLPSQGPVDMGATNISATVQNPTAPVSNITESINMTSPFEVTSTAKKASFLKDLKPVDTNMSSVSDVANIGSKTKDVLNVGGKVMGALGTVAGVAEMGSKEFKRKSNQYKSGTAMQTVLGGLSLVPGLQFLSLGSLAAGLLKGKK